MDTEHSASARIRAHTSMDLSSRAAIEFIREIAKRHPSAMFVFKHIRDSNLSYWSDESARLRQIIMADKSAIQWSFDSAIAAKNYGIATWIADRAPMGYLGHCGEGEIGAQAPMPATDESPDCAALRHRYDARVVRETLCASILAGTMRDFRAAKGFFTHEERECINALSEVARLPRIMLYIARLMVGRNLWAHHL